MPYAPQRPCNTPGCSAAATGTGYCKRHRRVSEYQRSGPSAYDYRWQRFRFLFIAANPVCVACGHLATDVDHITPHRGQSDPLFWDVSNLQSLCKACHARKTRRENSPHTPSQEPSGESSYRQKRAFVAPDGINEPKPI